MMSLRNTLAAMLILLAVGVNAENEQRANTLSIEQLADKIWQNEGAKKVGFLTHWNDGESFASMGIGHFIWFPSGLDVPFEESFPALLGFIEQRGYPLPLGLTPESDCLWPNREVFLEQYDSEEMAALRSWLHQTKSLQAAFIVESSKNDMSEVFEHIAPEKRERAKYIVERLEGSTSGQYALIDYGNFKGRGTSERERYQGFGWGLAQVLENMPQTLSDDQENHQFVSAFVRSADFVLTRRVLLAPIERNEGRWLAGWRKRLATYLD